MIRLWPRLARDRSGVISVELALIANFVLVPMTLGAVDAAQLILARARLDQVVHQALFYAYNNSNATNANVKTNAVAGYGAGTPPTVTPTITQYCITPATGYPPTGTPALPSNGSCTNGQALETYLTVAVSISVTLPFSVSWIAQTVTLSASGTARIA